MQHARHIADSPSQQGRTPLVPTAIEDDVQGYQAGLWVLVGIGAAAAAAAVVIKESSYPLFTEETLEQIRSVGSKR